MSPTVKALVVLDFWHTPFVNMTPTVIAIHSPNRWHNRYKQSIKLMSVWSHVTVLTSVPFAPPSLLKQVGFNASAYW